MRTDRKTGKTAKTPSVRNYRKKAGLPPGTLVYTGNNEVEPSLDLFSYNRSEISRVYPLNPAETESNIRQDRNNWLNICGLNNTETIELTGKTFAIHALLLEDVLNTESLPKIEIYDDTVFICLKMIRWNEEKLSIEAEQISFLIKNKLLISFQEREGDVFETVRARMLSGISKTREKGIDFLAYVLIDKIVDNYFLVLEKIEDEIENIESELLKDSDKITPIQLLHIKKQLILLRKYFYPLRDEVRKLLRDDNELIDRKTIKYLSDLHDHLQNIIHTTEGFRDTSTGLMELYSSNVSNKMNKIMKTLTVVGAIFIPLTFIAGIYGMNFDYMPELHFHYGYHIVMAGMALLGIGMVIYMRSRKWF